MNDLNVEPNLRLVDKTFSELSTDELYAILRLRVDVFVVEQTCPYPELDGRDHEPQTRHLWLELAPRPTDAAAPLDQPEIASYLRVLHDDVAWRVGRVVTPPPWRGHGLAQRLLTTVLDTTSGPLVLDAQSYLVEFYAASGFVACGPEFIDDGIPHVPMRLDRLS